MKVVLVHGKYFNSWEALGLGYIAAYVKRHEPSVDFTYFQGSFDEPETIIDACRSADILALSCTTPTAEWSTDLARRCKVANPALWVVVGGYHASALGVGAVAPPVDQVVVGEGETALLQIVRGNRRPVVRGLPMQFSGLPWPDRALIRNERNIGVAASENGGQRMTSFQSHRGCPFRCLFCGDGACKVLGRSSVRLRNVHDLLNEIACVTEDYDLDYFKFCDSTWNSNAAWVMEFCEEKIRRKLWLPYFANLHASIVTKDMVEWMAMSGCQDVAFGIESGSDRVLASSGKGITTDQVRRAVGLAKGVGLKVRGYFLLGMPGETEADREATEQLAEELDLDIYGFTILCPYPGSLPYQQNPQEYAGVDWEKADEYSNDFWRTDAVSNARLREWQDKLTSKFAGRLAQRQPTRETVKELGLD